ncbi:MAG: TolC family protein [Cyanobacteria bacterium SIG29]|nr:TolC family protein [Cyanobacteria bacterium SIG29]
MKKILVGILILLTANIGYTIVDTTKVSIQDAVSIATKNNLDIQASRLNINIEEQKTIAANRLQNPEFGTSFNLGKAGRGESQEVGLSQLIEIGKRSPRKNLAKSNLKLSERFVEYLEFDLRMDVREAYTNLLAKKSVRTTMKEQETLLKDLLEQAKEKHKTGEVSEIDVLQAQLLLNQIITEVQASEFAVKNAIYEFNKVINCPDGFYDTIEEHFTEDYKPLLIPKVDSIMPDFETISNQAINNRYDIKIALQQIEVAEKELHVILRQKVPDIEIKGGYLYQTQNQSRTDFKNGAFVGANIVNIPLFHRYKPEIEAAKLKLEQAHLNYASVENKALNDLRKAYEKFLIAQLRLKNYNEQLITNSEELIKASRKSYTVDDKTDLTTLITMEESYRTIIVAYTYSLADYYNAWNAFIREVNNEQFTIIDEKAVEDKKIEENV